jgi:hypothetical protein
METVAWIVASIAVAGWAHAIYIARRQCLWAMEAEAKALARAEDLLQRSRSLDARLARLSRMEARIEAMLTTAEHPPQQGQRAAGAGQPAATATAAKPAPTA